MNPPQDHQANPLLHLLVGALLVAVQLLGVLVVGVGSYLAFDSLLPSGWQALLYTLTVELGLASMIMVEVLGEALQDKKLQARARVAAGVLAVISGGAVYFEMSSLLAEADPRFFLYNLELTAAILGPTFVVLNLLVAGMIGRLALPVVAAWEARQRELVAQQGAEQERRSQAQADATKLAREREESRQAFELKKLELLMSKPAIEPAQQEAPAIRASEPAKPELAKAELKLCPHHLYGCGFQGSKMMVAGHQAHCRFKPEVELAHANGHKEAM
jgi:hypothetical protein